MNFLSPKGLWLSLLESFRISFNDLTNFTFVKSNVPLQRVLTIKNSWANGTFVTDLIRIIHIFLRKNDFEPLVLVATRATINRVRGNVFMLIEMNLEFIR